MGKLISQYFLLFLKLSNTLLKQNEEKEQWEMNFTKISLLFMENILKLLYQDLVSMESEFKGSQQFMMSEAALLDPLVKLISTILVDLKPLFLFFGTPKMGIFGGLTYIVKWSVVKHFQRSWLRLCESEKS